MNKSMLTGVLIGAAVATAGGAIAGYTAFVDTTPTEAEVLDVAEITETQRTPREVCNDVAVTRQKPVQDQNRILGTIAGAVVGGALGNQVGGGSGKKIATVPPGLHMKMPWPIDKVYQVPVHRIQSLEF